MQRRRREHEAQRREPRRDVLGQALRPVGAQEHDRRRRAAEKLLFVGVDRAIAADDRDIGRHQRERLPLAALQMAQPRHSVGVGRVAGEVKSAQTLDGDDLPLLQQGARRVDVVERRVLVETHGAAVETDQARPGAAGMAGDGLGVESAIGWISVFLRAGAAHDERRHGRHGAVIGDAGDDAQPGPAMSAIGERIAEAAL